jgi:transcriptional regulator with XRE-family HTH domain
VTPAQLIRTARRRRRLSQTRLAAFAGTSQPVISAYENGHRDPTTGTLARLVAAAGERLELSLASRSPEIPPATSPDEHARRLHDVLLLADAFPARPHPDLAFPRIDSSR